MFKAFIRSESFNLDEKTDFFKIFFFNIPKVPVYDSHVQQVLLVV